MREFLQLISNKRFRQVFSLFVIFVLQFWWLNKRKGSLTQEEVEARYGQLYRQQAKAFTEQALELGGLLIKLGQFFSSRVDILPMEYIDELAKLQDAVEPLDSQLIRQRIEEELSAPVTGNFASFSEEAVAAASLGQVHKARLHSGEAVAVKVLRPGIEDIVAIDLETLKVILAFVKRYRRISDTMDLDQVYLEFKETVNDELDYIKEANNARRFREIFKNDQNIYIPEIYESYSTKRVLVMEFVEGFKINDFGQLDRKGFDRRSIAKDLVSCYLRQVLVEGFFHADPHPGNLLVKEDGALILLDFGMVGRVSKDMKGAMVNLALALFKKDAGAVVEAFDELGFLRPHADKNTLNKSVGLMLNNLHGESLDMRSIDFGELSLELRELVYSQPFQLPARTTFLGKALITVFGISNGLDNDFDLMETVSPYIEEVFLPGQEGSGSNIVTEELKKTLLGILSIPDKVSRFIDGIESGDIRVHPSRTFEQKLYENQAYFTNRIVAAILASGFALAGAQVIGTYKELGFGLLAIATAAGLMLFRSNRSKRRPMKRGRMGSGFKQPRFHP